LTLGKIKSGGGVGRSVIWPPFITESCYPVDIKCCNFHWLFPIHENREV